MTNSIKWLVRVVPVFLAILMLRSEVWSLDFDPTTTFSSGTWLIECSEIYTAVQTYNDGCPPESYTSTTSCSGSFELQGFSSDLVDIGLLSEVAGTFNCDSDTCGVTYDISLTAGDIVLRFVEDSLEEDMWMFQANTNQPYFGDGYCGFNSWFLNILSSYGDDGMRFSLLNTVPDTFWSVSVWCHDPTSCFYISNLDFTADGQPIISVELFIQSSSSEPGIHVDFSASGLLTLTRVVACPGTVDVTFGTNNSPLTYHETGPSGTEHVIELRNDVIDPPQGLFIYFGIPTEFITGDLTATDIKLFPRSGTGPVLDLLVGGGDVDTLKYSTYFLINNLTSQGYYDLEIVQSDSTRDTVPACVNYIGFQGYQSSGTLSNAITGHTIRGAGVSIWQKVEFPTPGFELFDGMIATDGTYSFDVPPGEYKVLVQYELSGEQWRPPHGTFVVNSPIPYEDIYLVPVTDDTEPPVLTLEITTTSNLQEAVGTCIDSGVGISVLEVVPGTLENLDLFIEPFENGDTTVVFTAKQVESSSPGTVTILCIDQLGNFVASPIILQSPVVVHLDIKPGSCPNPLHIKHDDDDNGDDSWGREADAPMAAKEKGPHKKKAVVPVAILGTADFDVTLIDPTTVALEGIPALRWEIEDEGVPVVNPTDSCDCTEDEEDGYLDLEMKFNKKDLIDALGEVYDGELIPLTITGELTDGTPFEGTDCVLIRKHDDGEDEDDSNGNNTNIMLSRSILEGNYPNPFNPTTEISFSLLEATHVRLEIYNVTGQKVTTIVDGFMEAGTHSVIWDGGDAASGVYLYRLQAGEFVETRKMMLLK